MDSDRAKGAIPKNKSQNGTEDEEKNSSKTKSPMKTRNNFTPKIYGRRLPKALRENPEVSHNYRKLYRYTLSLNKLKDSGYPLETDSGEIEMIDKYKKLSYSEDDSRVCRRCWTKFSILEYDTKESNASSKIRCYYHNGKKTYQDDNENLKIYTCCGKSIDSNGCQTYKYHVCNFNWLEKENFIKTNKNSPGVSFNIYALDCEMCYTTKGFEVTRITIVDINKTIIYDTYIVPQNEIIDYNTSFSGITAEHLKNVKTTLADVQAKLSTLLTANTILIGHSLEHDFRALRLSHLLVIDTYMVFWGKDRSLKNLAKTYLDKPIQQGEHGHDGVEDARTCIELMLWKIENDGRK